MSSKTSAVLGGAMILLIAMGVGIAAAWWFFQHGSAELSIRNQKATIVVPGALNVSADVLNDLAIELSGSLKTVVPIDQNVTVPIKDTLHVMATLDHDVPIKMNVAVHDNIPVDQIVHVDAKVAVLIMGHTLTLPIRGDVPIKATVPISMDIPVDQMVHMKFTAPAEVKLTQPLIVPLKADVATTIPLHSKMNVPIKSVLQASVRIPDPVEAVVTQAQLKLPMRSLGLHMGDQSDDHAASRTAAPAASARP